MDSLCLTPMHAPSNDLRRRQTWRAYAAAEIVEQRAFARSPTGSMRQIGVACDELLADCAWKPPRADVSGTGCSFLRAAFTPLGIPPLGVPT